MGVDYAVTFNSGTSALHAALLALRIHKLVRDAPEVVVPSFTFIATANSVLFVGGRPVFADIEEERYGLDPERVAELVSDRTAAVMPIHYGGSRPGSGR